MPKGYKSKTKEFSIAQISHSNRAGYVTVITPYNPDFVEALKTLIPYPHRMYNAEDKNWDVSQSYLAELVQILKIYFDDVVTDIGNEPKKEETKPLTGNVFAEIFKIIPNQYRDKVYLSLSNAVHPDHGGSNDVMKQLNIAYQELKK